MQNNCGSSKINDLKQYEWRHVQQSKCGIIYFYILSTKNH